MVPQTGADKPPQTVTYITRGGGEDSITVEQNQGDLQWLSKQCDSAGRWKRVEVDCYQYLKVIG